MNWLRDPETSHVSKCRCQEQLPAVISTDHDSLIPVCLFVSWVCLKMLCTPLYPMVLLIIIPIKWLFHWEYTLFSDKPSSTSPRHHILVIFLLFLRDFRPRRTWLTRGSTCYRWYRWYRVAQPVGWWLVAGSHNLDAAIQLIETSIRLFLVICELYPAW